MINKYRKNPIKKKGRMKPVYSPVDFQTIYETWKQSRIKGRKVQSKFAILYLTGARVSEVIQLRKNDFKYLKDKNGDEVLTIQCQTLKNRNEHYRILPLVKKDPYKKMIKEIELYLNHLDDHSKIFRSKDTKIIWRDLKKLDNFETIAHYAKGMKTPENVKVIEDDAGLHRKVIQRTWYPHYLRHCRLSHLVQYHNFDATRLMFWAGWSDPRLARTYIHLDWSNLAELIKSGQVPMNY